jgi:hypothetical protein
MKKIISFFKNLVEIKEKTVFFDVRVKKEEYFYIITIGNQYRWVFFNDSSVAIILSFRSAAFEMEANEILATIDYKLDVSRLEKYIEDCKIYARNSYTYEQRTLFMQRAVDAYLLICVIKGGFGAEDSLILYQLAEF